ncbi:MAG: PepB aminopeptidase [Alphaproteobacteria bacterium]|jgi:PepB aminopeptidase
MSYFIVEISQQAAPAPYSSSSLVSFKEDGAVIHIQSTQDFPVRALQKATRKIAALGVSDIRFVGQWTIEEQRLFVQSFCNSNFSGHFEWANPEHKVALEDYLNALLFTRKMINQTPEEMSPEALADQAEKWLKEVSTTELKIKRLTGEELKQAGWMGIYEVGRGSVRPPVFLEIDYHPAGAPDDVAVALVGKGITFDSGGYSIKSSEGMLDMKCDMGGAATVAGALGLAIMQGLNKRVKLFLCCAENLISGHAYKLGDIITYKNGTTVEIVNTDAEGRLVLADGLMAASETKAGLIINAATLTGAAIAALGKDYNAMFSMHDDASNAFLATSAKMNEPHWRLPLELWHQGQCPSPFADTANSSTQKGGGGGGASNAAGFLSRFVDHEECAWIHLDIAAAYSRNSTEFMPAGGTAVGIRSIAHTLLQA